MLINVYKYLLQRRLTKSTSPKGYIINTRACLPVLWGFFFFGTRVRLPSATLKDHNVTVEYKRSFLHCVGETNMAPSSRPNKNGSNRGEDEYYGIKGDRKVTNAVLMIFMAMRFLQEL